MLVQHLVQRPNGRRRADEQPGLHGHRDRLDVREVRRPAREHADGAVGRDRGLVDQLPGARPVLLELLQLVGLAGEERADLVSARVERTAVIRRREVNGQESAVGAGEVGEGAQAGGVEHGGG